MIPENRDVMVDKPYPPQWKHNLVGGKTNA